MGAFVIEGTAGLDLDLAFGFGGEGDVKVAVDGAGDGFGSANQIGIKDTEVGFGSRGDVIFFQVKEPRGSKFGVFEGFSTCFFDGGIDPVPDGVENADMGGDGFDGIAENVDDSGIGEFGTNGFDRTR